MDWMRCWPFALRQMEMPVLSAHILASKRQRNPSHNSSPRSNAAGEAVSSSYVTLSPPITSCT
eukprot:8937871-Ditylum_brightwellii.AAC.1